MKAEDIANEIVNRPELLQKVVESVYEKLREDLIIKRLDKLEELVKINNQHLDKLEEVVRSNNERINKLEEVIKINNDRINKLEESIKITNDRLGKLEEAVRISNDRLNKLEEAVKDLIEADKRHSDEIKKLYEQQLKILERIESLERQLINTKDDLKKSIDKLDKRFETFASRSGHKVEKAMMELYKEALELHGVDPNKVQHGEIIDEKGVAGQKGWRYEVDFYEVIDGEVYIFEVKTRGDKDAIKQFLDRKSVFESQGKKVTKMFLVCQVISKKDKDLAEKNGITVITGEVKEKS